MAPMFMERGVQVLVPIAGQVMSVIITMVALTAITSFFTQRVLAIKAWSRLPYIVWVVFILYVDSYLFVFTTALLSHSFGLNSSAQLCEGAILLCLACYVSTKLIYLFLVEKAYIIRGSPKKRMKSKLYLFNSFGIMSVFMVVVVLNFLYRIVRMDNGQCFIGMEGQGIIPLITFDALANTYLTLMFLIPLRKLYKFRNMARTPANYRLRTVALRTFIGALCTLISSVVNLTVLMALNGEPGWVCLMCCNVDVLFSTSVIHWVTSKDNAGTSSGNNSQPGHGNAYADNVHGSNGPRRNTGLGGSDGDPPPSTADEIALVAAARSHRRHSDFDDDDDESQADAVLSKTANPKGSVVVTTTIKRESRPNENQSSDSSLTLGGGSVSDPRYPDAPRLNRGGGAADVFSHPQTRISGGSPQSQR